MVRIIRVALIALSVLVLLGTVVFLVLDWRYIPDSVPMHFSFDGAVEGYGPKAALLLLPVLNAVAIAALSFSRTIRVRTFRRERHIPAPPLLMPLVCLPLTLGIAYLTVCAALSRPLGAWFLPVFLVASMLPLVVYSVRMLAGPR